MSVYKADGKLIYMDEGQWKDLCQVINSVDTGSKRVVVIKFGKWQHKKNNKYFYKRILFKGYKWTPFCERRKIYRLITNEEIIDTIKKMCLKARQSNVR